ncbi:MAG TPA: acyltransferase [Acidimicrobiia bacterium]|nr:acyltransferase [Acidimicrobiia bacterium]
MPDLRGLAEATPASRDRYVDFLRAFSIVTVVVGHFVIALIHWEDGRIYVHNAVGHQSGLWLATWVFQVMPIFFFVGGFANAVGWRSTRARGEGYGSFVLGRLQRLTRPTLAFVAVWIGVEVLLHLGRLGAPGLLRGTFLPFGPMWFLFVYMAVIALAPIMLALHDRHGITVLVVLAALAAVIDVARFGGMGRGIGWVNLVLVWVFIHQLGFLYADGSLVSGGKKLWWAMALSGLLVLTVLTNLVSFIDTLWYPRSMVGVDVEPVSNMSPPSFAIVALAVWQVGLAMLVRERAIRWLARPRVWIAVIAVNTAIMTLFLWHLTAYVITIVALYPLGLGQAVEPTISWWMQRPVWVLAPLVVLALLVAVFARFERPRT